MYTIYRLHPTGQECSYIGATTKTPEERCNRHFKNLRRGKHTSWRLQKVWAEYPDRNLWSVEVLERTDDPHRETFWIEHYLSLGFCLNSAKGANGDVTGVHPSVVNVMIEFYKTPEGKAWMSERSKKAMAPERRAEHSRIMKALYADPARKSAFVERTKAWVQSDEKRAMVRDHLTRMNKESYKYNRGPKTKTGYKGVTIAKSGRYIAMVRYDGKKHVSYHDTLRDAVIAYNELVLRIYGPEAYQNPIPLAEYRPQSNPGNIGS